MSGAALSQIRPTLDGLLMTMAMEVRADGCSEQLLTTCNSLT